MSLSVEAFTADVTDVGSVLVAPMAQFAPDLAERVPVDVFESVVILDSGALPFAGKVAAWMPAVSVFGAAAAVFLAVALVMLSRRRSIALITVGLAVLLAGLGVYAWSALGGPIAAGRITDDVTRVLVENGYAVFSRSLQTEGLALAIAGLAVAAVGGVGLLVQGASSKQQVA